VSTHDTDTLARWSLSDGELVWSKQLGATARDLLQIAGTILSLNEFPRLYGAEDGELPAEWPGLPTSSSATSLVWNGPSPDRPGSRSRRPARSSRSPTATA
jgi:hypothetical protein